MTIAAPKQGVAPRGYAATGEGGKAAWNEELNDGESPIGTETVGAGDSGEGAGEKEANWKKL